MGSGGWDPGAWATYASSTTAKPTSAIFASKKITALLNPRDVTMRESRDSADHPESTAIAVALDVTGSMGMIADSIARNGLGVLFKEILDRKPVSDPHLMFMGIGDIYCDREPLQVSQFEASNVIIDQLTELYLEGGGGGNDSESYDLAWYFAAKRTSIDCFEKRAKKGYLFTIGDEMPPYGLKASQLAGFFTSDVGAQDLSARELFEMALQKYHVYHIVAEEGSYARGNVDKVMKAWTDLMGQRVIKLTDYTKLSEVIVSTIQFNEGADKAAVAASWTGKTSLVVSSALDSLMPTTTSAGSGTVVRFKK